MPGLGDLIDYLTTQMDYRITRIITRITSTLRHDLLSKGLSSEGHRPLQFLLSRTQSILQY